MKCQPASIRANLTTQHGSISWTKMPSSNGEPASNTTNLSIKTLSNNFGTKWRNQLCLLMSMKQPRWAKFTRRTVENAFSIEKSIMHTVRSNRWVHTMASWLETTKTSARLYWLDPSSLEVKSLGLTGLVTVKQIPTRCKMHLTWLCRQASLATHTEVLIFQVSLGKRVTTYLFSSIN